jgi:hypothetical protein
MDGPNCRVSSSGARQLRLSIRVMSPGSISSSGPVRLKPALLTSRPISSPVVVARIGSRKASWHRSTATTRVSMAWRMASSSASAASRSARRAVRTTFSPRAATCRANSRPMPDDAPVTSAQEP